MTPSTADQIRNLKSAIFNPTKAGLSTERSIKSTAYFRSVAQLGMQAAEALDHAHLHGVVHRDVKPANLLVDEGGRLWVTDFGLAQLQSDARLTMTGDLVGTLRYMSPEQALAKRVVVDHRTDVYSLGVTLYELLTLEPAYAGSDRHELLRQIAFEEPRPPRRLNKAIPAELETIVQKAMEKNPADRYGTAQELADDLERWLKDEPIRARRPSWRQVAQKWARRHRALVRAAAVVLVLAVTMLAGTVGWVASDRAARRRATELVVIQALDESASWQQKRRLPEALSAARRAAGLAAGGEADEELRRRVRARVDDLELVAELEDARLQMTAVKDGHFDGELADRLYREAFRRAGLDVEGPPAEETGERIRGTSVAAELAAALDHWALQCRGIRGLADGKHLLRVARVADPDKWRDRVRDALGRGDQKALIDLARSAVVLRQAPSTLATLGQALLLLESVEPAEAAEALMRQAQQRHPDDFWVNHNLGQALAQTRPRRSDEALRFHTVAVALRPQSPGARLNLGSAFKEKRRLDEAITAYQEAIRLKKDYPEAHFSLGNALANKGRLDEAIAEYREAIRLKKDDPAAYNHLGATLEKQGNTVKAVDAYQQAIKIKPAFAEAYYNLGTVLAKHGKLRTAVEAFRGAIKNKSDYAEAYTNLGNTLFLQGKLLEAEEAHRQAIKNKPDFAMAYNNLGATLEKQGNTVKAVEAYQQAIKIKPDYADAYTHLGNIFSLQGKFVEAEDAHRQAIKINPSFAEAYNNRGANLARQGNFVKAVEAYQQAIKIKPDYAMAHYNLGLALPEKGRLDERIAAFRKAISLKIDDAKAHYSLGNALSKKGLVDEAMDEWRRTIRLKPDYAEAYCNLGQRLMSKGHFTAGLAAYRRGHELGSNRSDWRYPSAQWVRAAEQLVALESKLPKILKGEAQPADAAERMALAQLCQRSCKKLYVAAARFYADAFVAEPKLAEKLGSAGSRYNAACAAALAGCGQGKDANQTDDKERARLRRQALAWLRADLTAWRRVMEQQPAKASPAVRQQMQHWQEDKDFAGVRGTEALAKLPEAERQPWQKLWADVADTLGERPALTQQH